MRYSQAFIHTLFEAPKEAETASHIFLLRGSYIYPVAAGLYSLLPLGHRVVKKIKQIIREELNSIGGLEITMPVVNPAELWKKTRRYFDIGEELIRFKDRRDREFVLAMTHEEVVTDIAKQFVRSYRDLPVMLYQIQTKIRDEARPRAGLLRVREFFMKDAYSFHRDFDDLDAYYPKIFNAYLRIFARCGINSVPIEADSGIMGGTGSHEFMLESPSGEDRFVVCPGCGYSANTEKAVGIKPVQGLPRRYASSGKGPYSGCENDCRPDAVLQLLGGTFPENRGLCCRRNFGAGGHSGRFQRICDKACQPPQGQSIWTMRRRRYCLTRGFTPVFFRPSA